MEQSANAVASAGPTGMQRKEELGIELRLILGQLIALSLDGKQAHWHVRGQRFTTVHEQLDVIINDARTWADAVAERAITLGLTVDGRAEAIPATGFPTGWISDVEALRAMIERMSSVVESIRARLEEIGEMDLVTQGLVLDVTGGLEKHIWMLTAQLA